MSRIRNDLSLAATRWTPGRAGGIIIVGYQENGRWRTRALNAATVTDAKRERAALVGLREGRIASADHSTFAEVFDDWQQGRTIGERTAEHERHTPSDVARVMRSMRGDGLSEWTRSATYTILKGVFAHAERRGILTKNPADGLTDAERPKQKNAKAIERLDSATIRKLIDAPTSGEHDHRHTQPAPRRNPEVAEVGRRRPRRPSAPGAAATATQVEAQEPIH